MAPKRNSKPRNSHTLSAVLAISDRLKAYDVMKEKECYKGEPFHQDILPDLNRNAS
jgi:hypothetical protein